MEMQEYLRYFIVLRLEVIPWIIVANAIFAKGLKKKSCFALRAVCTCVIAFLLAAGMGVLNFEAVTAGAEAGWESIDIFPMLNVLTHGLFFFLSIGGLWSCFDEKPATYLFCAIAGYSAWNVVSILEDWIVKPLGVSITQDVLDGNVLHMAVNTVVHILLYLGVFVLLPNSISSIAEAAQFNRFPTLILFVAVLFVEVSARSYASAFRGGRYDLYLVTQVSLLCCSLVILFVQFFITQQFLEEQKKEVLLRVSQQRAEQYKVTKEMIDIINIKCHDLKHQLMALQGSGGVDPEYLAKLSESISIYSAVTATGNDALDTVLTDKSLLCSKNNIQLTYIASGKDIDFLSASDVYSLFGNALDNAIEYVMGLPEEKRVIKLFVGRRDAFIRVTVSNYFEGPPPRLVDGLPQTTKGDTAYHGYGMKSIKQITEHYGGNMTVVVEGKMFTLSILFPRQPELSVAM